MASSEATSTPKIIQTSSVGTAISGRRRKNKDPVFSRDPEKHVKRLRQKLKLERRKHKQEIKMLKRLHRKETCDKSKSAVMQYKQALLTGGCVSKCQLRCLEKKWKPGQKRKPFVHWEEEDLKKGLELRYKGQRAYKTLLKHGAPYPSISCLKGYISKIRMPPGLQHSLLNLMKLQCDKFSEMGRCAVIAFDEVNIDSRLEYSKPEDKIYGPHKDAFVVLVRGLFKNWSQPIYYSFDEGRVEMELLNSVIIALEKTGFLVMAVVCDTGPKNQGFWSEFQSNDVTSPVNYLNNLIRNLLFLQTR